jgi:hypothetical protein
MDSFHSADAEKAIDLLYGNADSPKFGGRTWTAAFPRLIARQLQIVQSGRSKNVDVMWCIDEIRLSRGGESIPPDRSWRVDAYPNPWDIGLALDGVAGTRWKSWESISPGMSVGIRFETPQLMDRVEVDSLDPQWDSRLSLRILTDSGQWLQPLGVWQVNPPFDARRNATRELEREGIHFVVVPKNAYNDRVLTNDPSVWGLREVAASRDATLYRIE